MNAKNKITNIQDEWERTITTLGEANILFEKNLFEGATSRAYYVAFHAAQAALITIEHQPKTHQGCLHLFNYHFVKSGEIEPLYSQILARAAKYREEADYRHTMVFTKDQTKQTIEEVELLLKRVKKLLIKKGYKIKT